jgi:hypothetical protein
VASALVTVRGSGYTAAPTVSLTGGGGSGATATANLSVASATVTTPGSGYTAAPTVTFAAAPSGGTTATGTATISGGTVTGITITNAGSGYTAVPAITFSGGGGTGAAATAVMQVNVVTITAGGSGYTSVPTLTFSASAGSGAAAFVEMQAATDLTGGSLVTSAASFTVGAGANLSSSGTPTTFNYGLVSGVSVSPGGSGYTAAPTVTFSAAPAGGTTATGTAIISGGAVTGVTITNPGAGYTAAPTVSFAGGGGSGAAATATLSFPAPSLTFLGQLDIDGSLGANIPSTATGTIILSAGRTLTLTGGGTLGTAGAGVSLVSPVGSGTATLNVNNGATAVEIPLGVIIAAPPPGVTRQFETTAGTLQIDTATASSVSITGTNTLNLDRGSGVTAVGTLNLNGGRFVAFNSGGPTTTTVQAGATLSGKGNYGNSNLMDIFINLGTLSATGSGTLQIDAASIKGDTSGNFGNLAASGNTLALNGPLQDNSVPLNLLANNGAVGGTGTVSLLVASTYTGTTKVRTGTLNLSYLVNTSGGGSQYFTASSGVTSVTVNAGGSGYTSVPTVSFSGGGSGAAATATLNVTSVTIGNGGSGYTAAPTVTFSAAPSGGTTATGTAVLTGGVVTSITITNAGAGYTSVPTITFSGGGGSGAAATAVMQVGAVTVTASGTDYGPAPAVGLSGGGGTGTTATANLSAGTLNLGSDTAGQTVTVGSGATVTAIFGTVNVQGRNAAAGVGTTIAGALNATQGGRINVGANNNTGNQIAFGATATLTADGANSILAFRPRNATLIITGVSSITVQNGGTLANASIANDLTLDQNVTHSGAWTLAALGGAGQTFLVDTTATAVINTTGLVLRADAGTMRYDVNTITLGTTGTNVGVDLNGGIVDINNAATGRTFNYQPGYTVQGHGQLGTSAANQTHVIPTGGGATFYATGPTLTVFGGFNETAGTKAAFRIGDNETLRLNVPNGTIAGAYVVGPGAIVADVQTGTNLAKFGTSGGFVQANAAAFSTATSGPNKYQLNSTTGGTLITDLSSAGTVLASGEVASATVTPGGTGYTAAPTVTFSAPPSGTTATGTATISGGAVTAITITNPGSGYTAPPTITITGGGGTGATAMAAMLAEIDFSGGSLITAPTFTIGAADNVIGTNAAPVTLFAPNGATVTNLTVSGLLDVNGTVAGNIQAASNGVFQLAGGATLTLSGGGNLGTVTLLYTGVSGTADLQVNGASTTLEIPTTVTIGAAPGTVVRQFETTAGTLQIDTTTASSVSITGTNTLNLDRGSGVVAVGDLNLNGGRFVAFNSGGPTTTTVAVGATLSGKGNYGNSNRLDTFVNNGTVTASGSGTLQLDAATINGTGGWAYASGNTLVLNGNLTDNPGPTPLALLASGAGKLTLAQPSTYTGGTTFTAGTLEAGASGALGTAAVLVGDTTGSAAVTLQISTGGVTLSNPITVRAGSTGTATISGTNASGTATYSGNITLLKGVTLDAASGGTVDFTGVLDDGASSFAVTKGAGTGTVVLGNANTYHGGTIFTAGTIALGNNAALGTGTFTINGGTVLASGGARSLSNALTLGGNFTVGGTNNLTLSGAASLTGTRTITVTNTGSTTLSGVISSTGAFGITKAGTGTLTLSGVDTYTGTTTINAGTLLVDTPGSIGAVTVNTGGTLGGTGTVGTVTVPSGGTVSPGDSPGTLNTADVSLATGAILHEELGGASAGQYDQLNVTGNVNLNSDSAAGSTLNVSFVNGFTPTGHGQTFDIITYTGTETGTFNGLAEGSTFVASGYTFRINYAAVAGSNHAVRLTALFGTASQLVFTTQPSTTQAGAHITPAVQVSVEDASGNVVTSNTSNVTVAIGTNPSGGTLSGALTVAAVAGVATFSDLSINQVGTGYTLTASDTGLTRATSSPFNITASTTLHLVFTTQPSNTTAGAHINPAVQVAIEDQFNNIVTSDMSNVTVAIGTNPGGGTLGGTLTVAAVNGVATFSDLSINKAGTGYTLTAADGSITGATSNAINITPAAASQVVFTTQPSNTQAGAHITPAVQVSVEDAFGNVVTSDSSNVTLSIGTNPSSGTLSGTLTVAAVSGVASFGDLSINKAGTGYTLTAADGSLTGATSSAFNITPAAASQVVFTTQPSNTTAGAHISPAVQVSVEDAFGNVVTTNSSNVTVAIGTNPSSGTLSGTLTVAAVSGVATFSDLSINKAGTGYTLTAADGALTGATSGAFNITPAAASQLVFTTQPSTTVAGAHITPAVQVSVEDVFGNVVTSNSSTVTVAIGTNPSGGTLSGTLMVAAVNGVASFSDLSINKAGTGYTLTAADGALTGATSTAFNINPATASQVVFTTQPTNTVAGAHITPAVQVSVEDAFGNVVTSDSSNVTVAIGTNPSSGTLSGTLTVAAVSGVASFSNLSINKAGTGYTLTAADGALTGATSTAFNVTPAAASQVIFTTQPTNTVAGAHITPAVQVSVEDAFGNVVTSDTSNVTVAIGNNPSSGTLSGTLTVAAVGGVASFSDLSINKAGTGYTLTAADGALTGATSGAFNITPAAASQLVFTTQPSNAQAGASISPAVQVSVEDAFGNVVTTNSSTVTVAIGTNPSSGTLSGTLMVAAVNGVASFSDLSINKAGTGYTLTAADGALTGATSNPFNITPAAPSQLVFTTQPSNTTAGAHITPAVQVSVEDTFGNVVTSNTSNVTVAIGTNPASGTLSGTLTVAAVSGVASFSDLSINKAGTGYTLTAGDGALTGATSGAFNIAPAAASQVVFSTQPTNTVAGAHITPAVQVSVEDAFGNVVTSDTSNVTVAIGTNPSGGTLSGTLTVAAVNGVASFSDLSINQPGTGYTLTAADGALTGATSTAFNITSPITLHLVFMTQPSTTAAGAHISPAVQVAVEDQSNNVVTSDMSNVTVAIGTNPSGGTLSGTLTVAAVNGVATFSNLSINKAGTGYTLTAADGSITGATSTAFNVTPAAASQLVFTTQPSTTQAGAHISPAVQVSVEDPFGNVVTSDSSNVTVAIGTNAGGGTLSGTLTVAAVSGVASFSDLSVNKAGTGYTLTAADGALTGATSTAFNITPAAASQVVFTTQPTNTPAGAHITPAVQVSVEDPFGNVVTSNMSNVTVAIGTNAAGGTLSGTLTVAAVNGVATFGDLSINKAGTGYTLTAADGALTGATSNPFNIIPAAASQLVFTTQPTTTAAGAFITPAVQVSVEDAFGNVVTGNTSNVTVAIGTNPSGGTLNGTLTVAAVNGVATFSNLSIDQTGTGYTLTASDGALTGATSNPFNITPGTTLHLVFTTQPSTSVAGAHISPAVRVTVEDQFNNVVTSDTSNVTVAIGTNPSGGTLGGSLTVAAVNGVATFSNLSINKAGTGYTLTASDGSITGATSTAFNITPAAASQLVFTTPPSSAQAGTFISPAVQVSVEDSFGNVVTSDTSNVTVAIGTNPSSGTLTGTLTVAAVNGVASFGDLSINKAGTGYTLTAADGPLTGATSTAFNITPAAPSQVVFTTQPSNTQAGAFISPAVQVSVEDAFGNVVTSNASNVTVALGSNPSGGTLSGTLTVAAVNGVATFGNLSINKAGTGYTLTASDGALTGATSGAFNITPAAASHVVFTTQPSSAQAGAHISPAVQVSVEDPFGNVVSSDSSNVTVAIGTNPGGGTLSGTLTVAAVNGVASFSDLSVNKAGTGYTLTATDGALTGATSTAFNITPAAASQVVFTTQPTNTPAGAHITPPVQVSVEDGFGNVVTGNTSNVTVAIGTNPAGGTLSGTLTVAAVNGVASFSDLSIDQPGTGYTLTASDGALAGATSNTFNITPVVNLHLVFMTQPSTTAAGVHISPAVQVAVEDQFNNVVTSDHSNITVAIGTNPGGGALSGTLTVAAVNGVATFSDLAINKAGTGYTLTASDGSITGATSNSFNITPAAASQVVFTTQPTNTVAGAHITPAVQVSVEDAFGNVVTSDTSNVAVALGSNPGGGFLNGTVFVAAVNGVATFGNLSINQTGTGYTLTASDGSLAGATSNAFNITPAAATHVAFSTQPIAGTAGAFINPAVQVAVEDQFNNVVTSNTSNITLALAANPGGGTLSGTLTVAAVNGVATFPDLSINKAADNYTLRATDGSLTAATSDTFNILPAGASQLVFTQQPSNTIAGAIISPSVRVAIEDQFGNVITSNNSTVSVAIGTNPGGGTLSGTTTVTAVSGVATFPNLSINQPGMGYTLTASDGALTGATSNPFNITPSVLTVTAMPASQTVVIGSAIMPVTITGTDPNAPGSSLSISGTYTFNGGPSHSLPSQFFMLVSTSPGSTLPGMRTWSFSGTVGPNTPPGTYVVTAIVSDGPRMASVNFTIIVEPVLAVAADPPSQSVQPGNPIQTVTIMATDQDSPGSGLTISGTYSYNGSAAQTLPSRFFMLVSTSPGSTLPGMRTWSFGGTVGPNTPPGTYVVTATVSDGVNTGSADFTIIVNPTGGGGAAAPAGEGAGVAQQPGQPAVAPAVASSLAPSVAVNTLADPSQNERAQSSSTASYPPASGVDLVGVTAVGLLPDSSLGNDNGTGVLNGSARQESNPYTVEVSGLGQESNLATNSAVFADDGYQASTVQAVPQTDLFPDAIDAVFAAAGGWA